MLIVVSLQAPPACDNLDSPCFHDFYSFKEFLVRYFVECSSIGICLKIFVMPRLELWALGGRPQRQNAISSHCVKGT